MRKRFEQQMIIGIKPIEKIEVNKKCRDAFPKLVLALKELYLRSEYNEKIFCILEGKITKNKKKTGRNGMGLWVLFVLAQTRLCLNISYDRLFHMANYDSLLRQILGIETEYGFKKIEIEYQNIIDNVSLLDDMTLGKINQIIVEMGHEVFKKKETEALRLKTDSFVVKSNVHFPTDYNLLFDSARKCADVIGQFLKSHSQIKGWRKLKNWHRELKNNMRTLGQSTKSGGKNKPERVSQVAKRYIEKARLFSDKVTNEKPNFPLEDLKDLIMHEQLEYYQTMLDKHIDLLERRIIKGEEIPHEEKIFSIFEPYTEWINKGKTHPNVELGKNLQVTSDQYHLIIDFKIMEQEVDKSTVIPLADRILSRHKVGGWSFDKGFYSKPNKELLQLFIDNLVMPKKGGLNNQEQEEEHSKGFLKHRKKHSAIESNINELGYRGLDQCPDKGYEHFKRYIALGICAYNLHRIGAELIRQEKVKSIRKKAA